MVEQRVIGAKIGAPRPIAPSTAVPEHKPEGAPDGSDKPKRSRKLLLVVLVVLAVVLAAAAAWFFLIHGKSTGAPEPEPTKTQVAGDVLDVDPVSVNLADGHYLRLGLAIQLSDEVTADPDPARALDLAIELYSGRSVDEVSSAAGRDQLKAQLLGELQQAYGPEVMDVYLTDYVTQ
jgi:flagellar FliL protein